MLAGFTTGDTARLLLQTACIVVRAERAWPTCCTAAAIAAGLDTKEQKGRDW